MSIFYMNYERFSRELCSPWASITPANPPPTFHVNIFFYVLLYILLKKKHVNIENFGTNLPFEVNIYTCRSFLRSFWFLRIFVFASIKCILNSLESISLWYQRKAYCITFQMNTIYIHFVAIKCCQTWKTYPSPFLKLKVRH